MKTITIIAMAALTAGVFTACKNSGKGSPDSADTLMATHTDTSAQIKNDAALEPRDSVQIQADMKKFNLDEQALIDKNTSDIAYLKQKTAKATGNMKVAYTATINTLQVDNDKMKARLQTYRMDSEDKWHEFKTGFSHDMDNLGDSIKAVSKGLMN